MKQAHLEKFVDTPHRQEGAGVIEPVYIEVRNPGPIRPGVGRNRSENPARMLTRQGCLHE